MSTLPEMPKLILHALQVNILAAEGCQSRRIMERVI